MVAGVSTWICASVGEWLYRLHRALILDRVVEGVLVVLVRDNCNGPLYTHANFSGYDFNKCDSSCSLLPFPESIRILAAGDGVSGLRWVFCFSILLCWRSRWNIWGESYSIAWLVIYSALSFTSWYYNRYGAGKERYRQKKALTLQPGLVAEVF